MKLKTIALIISLLTVVIITSCGSSRGTRKQRHAYNMEEQAQKDSDKASADYKQHHYDIQAGKTQDMMKQSKKRNKKLKKNKRESFFKRIFGSNKSPGCI